MNTETDRMLDYTIEGPDDAPILVFLHGWPDEPSMWRHQVEALKAKYRCVLPTLPNYGATTHEPGGCDFPEIVERLRRTIDAITADPITLVIHDWGAYIGYLFEKKYPEKIITVVGLDIGGHVQPSTIKAIAMFVSYQWALVGLWLIGGIAPALGTNMTRGLARLLKVPERQASSLHSRCNYPYFYFWRANLVPWLRSRLLGNYRPQCPVLFLYGGRKPLMFHTDRWLDIVEKTGGRSVCIERGQHWFMETEVEETNALLDEWLAIDRN